VIDRFISLVDWIWMLFGMADRMGPRMRLVVGFGDWFMGRGNFRANVGYHCNRWGVCGVAVLKCVNCQSCGLGWCMGSAEALVYQIGVHVMQGKGEALGVLFLIFTVGFPIWLPTEK